MTHSPTRTALILLAGASLAACASPNFPIDREGPPGQAVPAPAQPQPSSSPPAARAEEPPPEAPRRAAPVEARPLDAPTATANLPPAAPAAPAYTPPPAPTYRTVTTRSVTGKVIDVQGAPRVYEVKSGDNLQKIARQLDTTVEQLKDDNKLKSDTIRPGQELKGPRSKAKAYVVGQGDTLYAIARRFGVSATAIAEENDIGVGSTLRVGQHLRLPAGFKDSGPITTTSRVLVETPRPAAPPPQQLAQAQTPPPATASSAPVTTRFTPAPAPQTSPAATPAPSTARPPATTTPPTRPATSAPPPAQRQPAPAPAQALSPATPAPTPPPSRPSPSAAPVFGAPVASPTPGDAQISQMGRGRFVWPLRGEVISGFGPKGPGQRNDGLNIRAKAGEPVRAAADGDVVYAGDQVPGFGNLVLIKHADGWVTAYGHLSRVDVRMQQKVSQGQQIGQAGSTGGVAEPQLHFEVRYAPTPEERAKPIDPALVLPR